MTRATLQIVAAHRYTQNEEDPVGCGNNSQDERFFSICLKQKGWKLDMGMRNKGLDFGSGFYGHHPS